MSFIVADFDGTLAPVHGSPTDDQVDLLVWIALRGVRLAIVSGASAASIDRRFAHRVGRRVGRAIRYYPNNAGSCYWYDRAGEVVHEYDDAPAFEPHRARITSTVTECAGRYQILDLEDRESQVTLTVGDDPAQRARLVADLASRLGSSLLVRPAGRRSVDITLSGTTKARAVAHLAVGRTEVVVLGDSFGDGGNDLDLLHPSIAGATVYCAGDTVPDRLGFAVVRGDPRGPSGVYRFVRERFGC